MRHRIRSRNGQPFMLEFRNSQALEVLLNNPMHSFELARLCFHAVLRHIDDRLRRSDGHLFIYSFMQSFSHSLHAGMWQRMRSRSKRLAWLRCRLRLATGRRLCSCASPPLACHHFPALALRVVSCFFIYSLFNILKYRIKFYG